MTAMSIFQRLLCVLGTLVTLSALAADAGQRGWIQGSWVNLRASADTRAEVIDHLVVNTEVAIKSRQGDWCEIAVEGRAVRGFISCKLLGDAPVTLAAVGGDAETTGNAPRAFWLAPSAQRLMAAGTHFWRKLLTEAQRAKEEVSFDGTQTYDSGNPPKIVRYPVPEFEAMKTLMKTGVVAAPENRPAAARWSEIASRLPQQDNDNFNVLGIYLTGVALTLARQIKPAPVAPSLFKRETELASRSTSVEQLSAQFGIVERLRILGGPQWMFYRNENPCVIGAWDIGSYELTLDKPVVEYVIGRQGLAAASLWHARMKHDIAEDPGSCTEGMGFPRRGTEPLKGYPAVKDPLVWIYTPEALPYKKANIKRYAKRIPPQPGDRPAWQDYSLNLVVSHEIDLDGDGIADLAVWEGLPAGAEATVRFVLANIAGEWYLIEADSYTECT